MEVDLSGGVNDTADDAPDVLLVGVIKGGERELTTSLPPNDEIFDLGCQGFVDDGDIPVKYALCFPGMTANTEEVGAAGVSNE